MTGEMARHKLYVTVSGDLVSANEILINAVSIALTLMVGYH